MQPSRPDLEVLLSPSEYKVLELASQGLTNARVAAQLGVTVHTIKFHLVSIYRKLHVSNRTEAAAVFLTARSARPQGGSA
jgi:DNA-binding CsgD family transcriptional regulator